MISSLNELKEMVLTQNSDSINNFSNYVNTYKEEIANYNLYDSKEKYDSLITEAEQAITNKDYKNIDSLTDNLNQFKEEVLNKNIKALDNTIAQLETIDISKVSDKDSITNQIEKIKKLKNEKQFLKATELSNTLKEDINEKLETIKQEESEKASEFSVYTALQYLINSDSLDFLKNLEYVEYDGSSPYKINYITYFNFYTNSNSARATTTVFFYDSNSNPIHTQININPKYKNLKCYKVYVEQSHPNIGVNGEDEGTVRYGLFSGLVYENGVFEK